MHSFITIFSFKFLNLFIIAALNFLPANYSIWTLGRFLLTFFSLDIFLSCLLIFKLCIGHCEGHVVKFKDSGFCYLPLEVIDFLLCQTVKLDYTQTLNSAAFAESESVVAQSCLTLFDSMDCSLPGFPVHGISQARILEMVAVPFSRESSDPGVKSRSPTLQADSLPSEQPGKLFLQWIVIEIFVQIFEVFHLFPPHPLPPGSLESLLYMNRSRAKDLADLYTDFCSSLFLNILFITFQPL